MPCQYPRSASLRDKAEPSDGPAAEGELVFHLFALPAFKCEVIRGRTGGGPPALKAKDLAAAAALLKNPEITVAEIARRLGVAASTLYRHLPRARTAALDA
jgi:DNA-binding transcriptional ArsR family regulator